MILAVAGSRSRNSPVDKQMLKARIKQLKPDIIITGGIKHCGTELFAKEIAKELNIKYHEFPAPQAPPNIPSRQRTRDEEMSARIFRRKQVARLAHRLLLLPAHPGADTSLSRHGWVITAFWFLKYHDWKTSWKFLEIL